VDDLFAPSDVSWTPVSPKLAAVRRLNAGITAGLAGIVLLIVLGMTVGWVYGVLALLVAAAGFVWAWVLIGRNQRSWKYAEREDELLVSHGIMFRELVVVAAVGIAVSQSNDAQCGAACLPPTTTGTNP